MVFDRDETSTKPKKNTTIFTFTDYLQIKEVRKVKFLYKSVLVSNYRCVRETRNQAKYITNTLLEEDMWKQYK